MSELEILRQRGVVQRLMGGKPELRAAYIRENARFVATADV